MRRTSLHTVDFLKASSEMRLVPNSRHKHHILTRHFLPKNERMGKMRYFFQMNLPTPFRTNTTTGPPQLSTKNLRRRGFINPNLVH
jgi:hypothetical protein